MLAIWKDFEKKYVISFFCDRSQPNKHLTGVVYAYNDDEIIVQHISPEGRYDGFVLIHSEDIYRVDINGKYEQKIQKLYKIKGEEHPVLTIGNNLYDSLLEFSISQRVFISIETDEIELSGFLINFNSDVIHLQLVNEFGELDGETILSADQIISISVDSEREQNTRQLYNARKMVDGGEDREGFSVLTD